MIEVPTATATMRPTGKIFGSRFGLAPWLGWTSTGNDSTVKLLEVTFTIVAVSIAADLTRAAAKASEALKLPEVVADDKEAVSAL